MGSSDRALRFAIIGSVCWLLTACNAAPTTVLLDVSAMTSASLEALYGQVSIGSHAVGEQQISGPAALPGTVTVALPDSSSPAIISLRGTFSDGSTLGATLAVQPVPHQQLEVKVVLTANATNPPPGTPDGGAPFDLAQGTSSDLAPPPADLGPIVLAQDTFQRPDQSEWGTASDGHVWGADANTSNVFSIANNLGTATDSVVENWSGALGPSVADSDVLIAGSVSSFGSSNANNELAAMVRWTNNTFYKAGLNGSILRIFVRTSSTQSSTLASVSFPATANVVYQIRFRAVGTSLMAKAWPLGQAEPTSWMVTATDNRLTAGNDGIRLVFSTTATFAFSSFIATAP